MNRQHQAFTLIELLVVIAIIAILAAILFPVFAQAKNAAKNSVEISNLKQNALAIMMYNNDSDDMFPKRGTINWGGWGDGTCNGTVGCLSWDKLIQPYSKSYELLAAPNDRTATVPFPYGNVRRSFRAAKNVFPSVAGMPWVTGGTPKATVGGSAIGSPSGTIMLTNQRDEGAYSGTWWVYSQWFENWVWWTGSESTRPNTPLSTPNAGDTTPDALGGPNNYWRGVDVTSGRANYAFTDGSAGSRPAGFIFPGYERRANVRQIAINNQFPGVCTDAFEWQTAASGDDNGPFKDCALPQ